MDVVKNDYFVDFLILKKYRILRHMSILFLLAVIIMSHNGVNPDQFSKPLIRYYLLAFAYLMVVIMFYINMYFLIPRFLYKKSYIMYLVSFVIVVSLGFMCITVFEDIYIAKYRIKPRIDKGFFIELFDVSFILMPFILASTTLKLFQWWITNDKKINELENKALKSELKALKNQINPHFLFNMLNNLNVLIKKDQEKASQVTLKLSDFLRHHLYENNQASVTLVSEIKFINDFLELEKIRRDDFTFTVESSPHIHKNLKVPPNIFTVFVENAIKHSKDPINPTVIKIYFEQEEDRILFSCVNTKTTTDKEDNEKGIGLKYVKRRLDLLYENTYDIQITDSDTSYQVKLKLPL